MVKEGSSDQRYLDQATREHEVASLFDSPLLRQSYKLIRQRAVIRVSEVLVLMELVSGRTLETFRWENHAELCQLMLQVARGLGVMHNEGYVHADIKPNNLMVLADKKMKIIDFGQSCPIGTVKERIQGTPDYIAPEQVKRRAITAQTDVFNLGATMYWLLTSRYVPTMLPKGEPGMQIKSEAVSAATPPIELDPKIPPALSSLVMDCIEASPSNRPDDMVLVASRLEIAQLQSQRKLEDTGISRRTSA